MFYNLLADTPNIKEIVIFIVLIVAVIGLFIWSSISNKKKQKTAQEKLNSLKIGDRVKTIGGVCGFVVEVRDKDNTFVLETGLDTKKCYVRFDKNAIYQTAPNNGNVEAKEEEKPKEEKPVEAKTDEKPVEAKVEEKPKTTKKAKAEKIEVPSQESAKE